VNDQRRNERTAELAELLFDVADALFGRVAVRQAFAEAASDLELWERARRDPLAYLGERGITVPEGIELTLREASGGELGDDEDPGNLALLSEAAHHASKATLGSGTTLVAIEPSDTVKLVYSCKLVEICRSVSDPAIMGGKILWGCRTVCVGTGWVKTTP
jgi:hypothetical protein